MAVAKQRLDVRVVDDGLAESRTKAQALIMAGVVIVDDVPVTKAGTLIPDTAVLRLKGETLPYVSRGGVKLARGLEVFQPLTRGIIALDVGASTGGFTDVLLQQGAAKVYAVDVGYNQLAWKLRDDSRVVVLEKLNAKEMTCQHIPEPVDAIVSDVSFISVTKVLPAAMALAKPSAWLLILVKPQFEAGREQVGKGGIVRDEAVHAEVCERVRAFVDEQGWQVQGIIDSPIRGATGNKEFLLFATRQAG